MGGTRTRCRSPIPRRSSSTSRGAGSERARAEALDDGGERLERPPRRYDPEHPHVEDLERKGFTASASITQREACFADFLDRLAKACRCQAPLMECLPDAVGLDW